MKTNGSSRLAYATLLLITTSFGVRAQSGDQPSHEPLPHSKCTGVYPCVSTVPTNDLNRHINYWYNTSTHQCSALALSCMVNESLTFVDVDNCRISCGVSIVTSPTPNFIGGCESTQQGCTGSNNDTPHWQTTAVVLGVTGTVVLLVLLVVVAVTVYYVRRRRKIQHRRFLENMLHLLTEDSGTDTDEWEDNPEDNNLFDRLEKHSK